MKPRIEINKIRKNDNYRYLFLEYKRRDLNELKYKTCQEVGIKNDRELILNFIEHNFNEQYKIYIDIDNDNVNIKSKKNISNISHNYEHFYSSDNRSKVNVSFKNHKGGKRCNVFIETDKSIKDLIEKYLDKILRNQIIF